MDTVSKDRRSKIMARVRSAGNLSTEMKVAGLFRRTGLKGWRRSSKILGKPDFVFAAARLAVFVDGCFWHGCSKCYRRPNTNRKYWDDKILRNRIRDKYISCALRGMGWYVVRIWEHELKKKNPIFLKRIANLLSKK